VKEYEKAGSCILSEIEYFLSENLCFITSARKGTTGLQLPPSVVEKLFKYTVEE
jgi:hypothetical protein